LGQIKEPQEFSILDGIQGQQFLVFSNFWKKPDEGKIQVHLIPLK
jgi:hypothetical protein